MFEPINPYDFYPTETELQAKKREYAAALIRDPWHRDKAARFVEPRETHISYIVNNWQFDNDVNRYMRELQEEKKTDAIIPTKEDFAASVFRDALTCRDADTKLNYYKLFASVMGFIEKPSTVVNNNNNTQKITNVLVMPAMAKAETIEHELVEYQHKLISGKL